MPTLSDPRHQEFLEWLCTRKRERNPSTKTALAEKLGVNIRTLRDWQEKPEFQVAHEALVRQIGGGPERFQEILEALHETATGPDQKLRATAARTWGDMTGFLSSQVVKTDKVKTSDLSDEELLRLRNLKVTDELEARGVRVITGAKNGNHRQAG